MIKTYGAYTNRCFISLCEKECEFVNYTLKICSFYIYEESIIKLIKELNTVIKKINKISKSVDEQIIIYTTINIHTIVNIIGTENIVKVKDVIELIKKIDYNFYSQISAKLNLKEQKNEEIEKIKDINQTAKYYSNILMKKIKENKKSFY